MADPTSTNVNTEYKFLAFSLYAYQSSSPCDDPSTGTTEDASGSPNFSLSLICSDLKAHQDTELQQFLCKKMTKGSLSEGASHIATINISLEAEPEPEEKSEISILCYYRLLKKSASSDLLSLSLEGDDSSHSSHYLICLLASSDTLLDLFRPELDAYSISLVGQLNAFDPLLSLDDADHIGREAQKALCNWYQTTAAYLCSCVQKFSTDIKYIIYAALMNTPVEVKGTGKELPDQIQRFLKCCSLSEMLNSDETSKDDTSLLVDTDVLADVESSAAPLIETPALTIHIHGNDVKFSSHECTKYCADWGQALAQGDITNPAYLKQVIDNYKLKTIQDLNTLKRHVKQAEANHYSLFKCYTFLQSCSNESVLMKHAESELHSSKDSMAVIQVLSEFLQETSQQL